MALKNLSDWNEKGSGRQRVCCESRQLVVQHVGQVSLQNQKRNQQPVAVRVGLENNFSNSRGGRIWQINTLLFNGSVASQPYRVCKQTRRQLEVTNELFRLSVSYY